MQYFLIQLPSVRMHAQNMVKYLAPHESLKLIKYLALMYSKLDFELLACHTRQPWERKRELSNADKQCLEVLGSGEMDRIYDYLL